MRKLYPAVAIVTVLASNALLAQDATTSQVLPLTATAIEIAQRAYQPPELPDAATRRDELRKWVHDFSEWKEWYSQWGNRREPGWFKDSRARRQRPDPPEWLFNRCISVADEADDFFEACTMLVEWSTPYPVAQTALLRSTAISASEDEEKTTWWEHVHLDGGWPALQSGVSLYGVIGVHATTHVHGRLEVFVAPGAMLLNVPMPDGSRAWKVATNYGITYRLGQFTLPGERLAFLHLNLVKAWLLDAGNIPTKSTDFVGLSLTFKKKQP